MSNETAETKIINAQDGKAVRLSTKQEQFIRKLFTEVDSEWNELGDDLHSKVDFMADTFVGLQRSLFRCGYIVHKIDSEKLYRDLEYESAAELLEDKFKLNRVAVTRFRLAYAYALPISETVPEVTVHDLNEGQMRELRKSVKELHPDLKKEDQVKKAVELYAEVHKERPLPKAPEIAEYCKRKIAEKNKDKPKSEDSAQVEEESAEQPANGNSEEAPSDDAEDSMKELDEVVPDFGPDDGFIMTDEELGEPVGPMGEVKADDYFGTQLANELSELLGLVLEHSFIEDEIKERFERAFEQLGIEPTHPDEEQEDDYE